MESEDWYLPSLVQSLRKQLPDYESWQQVAEAKINLAQIKDDMTNDEQERRQASRFLEVINKISQSIGLEIELVQKTIKKIKTFKKDVNRLPELQNKLDKLKKIKQTLLNHKDISNQTPLTPIIVQDPKLNSSFQKVKVSLRGEDSLFQKGLKISQIKNKLQIDQSYYCFSLNKKLYKGQTLQEAIKFQKSIIVKAICKRYKLQNVVIQESEQVLPISKPLKQVTGYFDLTPPLQQNVTIHTLKTNLGSQIANQAYKISDYLTEEKSVIGIQTSYHIDLTVEVINLNIKSKQIQLKVRSTDKIQILKKKHEKQIGIQDKYQKWMVGGHQILSNSTFQSERLLNKNCRIQITSNRAQLQKKVFHSPILNFQSISLNSSIIALNDVACFYGFRSHQKIQTELFTQFYIEDDKSLSKLIKQMEHNQCDESQFRNSCLRIIFSALKKHCLISSALQFISDMLEENDTFNQIWESKTFNQNFILFYILKNSEEDLSVRFMNIYKHYSPLPIKFYSEYNVIDLKHLHFWTANKSMVIFSMGFDDKVWGKTTFLNKIFNLSLQQYPNRHSLCSKSVNIMYNIFGDCHFMVDLIDASNESLSQAQKLDYLKMAEVIIIHHIRQHKGKVEQWLKQNSQKKIIILVEHYSEHFQKKQGQCGLYIKIPNLNQNTKSFNNELSKLIKQINQRLTDHYKKDVNFWRFIDFLAEKTNKTDSLDILKKFDQSMTQIIGYYKLNNSLHPFLNMIIDKGFINSREGIKKIKQFSRIRKKKQNNNQPIFTFESFWRQVLEALNSSQFQRNNKNQVESLFYLFTKQVASSQTFQIINGDNLELQIKLLKKKDFQFKKKKIKVIGILGLQSSGKSTLLNFLFGCDFMSSQGRCTNGIYGTYYDVGGKNIPDCEGILLLDTEGLFANYKRQIKKGDNFDNKLVLFLIKICDILIINTRGDIDSKIQAILQLAFDNQLIDVNDKMPKIFIVMNHGVEEDINNTQRQEISEMIKKIVSVCPKMQNLIMTEETQTLPNAFITSEKKECFALQKQKKKPTQKFYRKTKTIAVKIMKWLQINIKQGPRTVQEVYEKMDIIWTTIMNVQLLTKYTNKTMKQFSQTINCQKGKAIKKIQQFRSEFKNYNGQQNIQNLLEKLGIKVKQVQNCVFTGLQKVKIQGEQQQQKRLLINRLKGELQNKIKNYQKSIKLGLKLTVHAEERTYFKEKAIKMIISQARRIRNQVIDGRINLSDEQLWKHFADLWVNYSKQYQETLKRPINAQEAFDQVQDYFQINYKLLTSKQLSIQSNPDIQPLREQQVKRCDVQFDKFFIQECSRIEKFMTTFFQYVQCQPVINKSLPCSLPLKYLNMSQLFVLKNFNKEIYLTDYKSTLKPIISDNLIAKELQLSKEIQEFIQKIKKIFGKINTQLDQTKLIKQLCQMIVKSSKNYIFNEKVSVSDIAIFEEDKIHFMLAQGSTRFTVYPSSTEQAEWLDYLNNILKKQIQFLNSYHKKKNCLQKTFDQFVNKICYTFITRFFKTNGREIIQQAEKSLSAKMREGLQAIGLDSNQSGPFSSKPIKIKNMTDLLKLIDNLPNFFDTSKIKKSISEYRSPGSIKIGQITEPQNSVKPTIQDSQRFLQTYVSGTMQEIIKVFRNPSFKKLMCKYIKPANLFQSIKQIVENEVSKKSSIERATYEIIKVISQQIADFDKDLSQISHKLTYYLKSRIYTFGMVIIWKKYEYQRQMDNQQKRKSLNLQREEMYTQFFSIVRSKIDGLCKIEANQTFSQFLKYLKDLNNKQKSQFLLSTKKKLTQIQQRKKFQLQVYSRFLEESVSDEEILDYLKDPKKYFQTIYQQISSKLYNQQVSTYKVTIQNEFKQFYKVIKSLKEQVQKIDCQWTADAIIQQTQVVSKQILWRIFIKLLIEGKTISNQSQEPQFKKIKNDCKFITKLTFQKKLNKDYFRSLLSKDCYISHFLYFLKFLLNQATAIQDKFDQHFNFNEDDKKQFEDETRFQICHYFCPCCKALCDVDIKVLGHDHTHECSFGHFPRANSGIRLKVRSYIYSSIFRCQDIPNDGTFQFDGKTQIWKIYKDKHKEWNFDANPTQQEKNIVQRIWKKSGRKICEWRQIVDKQKMEYYQSQKAPTNYFDLFQFVPAYHYAFAIDGSGSMQGAPWQNQLQQLKIILADLARNEKNVVSIVVFNHRYQIIFKKASPSSIDVKTIPYLDGGTSFEKALEGSIKCFQRGLESDNLHFVMITDGLSNYPSKNIMKMLELKQKCKTNKCLFESTIISIGQQKQTGKTVLAQITKQLQGTQKWVHNINLISDTFRQIMLSDK